MKSKVHIKGHPLHPILVSFPIAFFIATLVLDIVSVAYRNEELWRMAGYLEGSGIALALLAAVPGFIDFLFTVPPNSSGKKRAAKHGLINVTMVIIFSTALFIRQQNTSMMWIIGLEATGVILLTIAGWMGGTLVYRNQIGIDLRYAQAGKWREIEIPDTGGQLEVGTTAELSVDQMKLLRIGNLRIVLCRTEQGHTAFDDRCTHRGGSLAGGAMICGTVQCPWHGSQFDVRTGVTKAGPATQNIKTYPVEEANGKLFIHIRG